MEFSKLMEKNVRLLVNLKLKTATKLVMRSFHLPQRRRLVPPLTLGAALLSEY